MDVVILDTLAALFAVPSEIDNNAITKLMNRLSRAARSAGCAVLLLHHTPKMTRETAAGQRGEATLVRGGSAISNSARVVLTITPLPAAEAGLAAIQGLAPEQVRRLEHVKVNDMAPMDPLMFEIKSIQVKVHDGSAHAVRAVDFLPALPSAATGTPVVVRNLTMQTIDAGTTDGHGTRVPFSPGGGKNNTRDVIHGVADALKNAMNVPEASARSAAREAVSDLLRIGCVTEQDVQVPQYKSSGQPNGKRVRRGLVCHWHLAPWDAAPSSTPPAHPVVPGSAGAATVVTPSQVAPTTPTAGVS